MLIKDSPGLLELGQSGSLRGRRLEHWLSPLSHHREARPKKKKKRTSLTVCEILSEFVESPESYISLQNLAFKIIFV